MRTTGKRRGFSLMEVLIAMGIAGVGLCGIMTALPVIAFQVQKIRSHVSGDQLAQLAQETVRLQNWWDASKARDAGSPTIPYLSWANYNAAIFGFEVPVAAPILIDPLTSTDPFPSPITPFPPLFVLPTQSTPFSFPLTPPITPFLSLPQTSMFTLPTGLTDDARRIFFRSFFTDPTSLKVSANPGSERPELTYVSLNGSIAPDRNDDYSWFYTVLPEVNGSLLPATTIPLYMPSPPSPPNTPSVIAYHVSIIVSRARAFDDPATHRVYNIASTTPGTRADTVYLNVGDAAIGKYAAVVIPGYIDGNYGSYLRWYKVLMARATTGTQTRVLLQPIPDGPNLTTPTGAVGFLITADSIIEVQSFSVGP